MYRPSIAVCCNKKRFNETNDGLNGDKKTVEVHAITLKSEKS